MLLEDVSRTFNVYLIQILALCSHVYPFLRLVRHLSIYRCGTDVMMMTGDQLYFPWNWKERAGRCDPHQKRTLPRPAKTIG